MLCLAVRYYKAYMVMGTSTVDASYVGRKISATQREAFYDSSCVRVSHCRNQRSSNVRCTYDQRQELSKLDASQASSSRRESSRGFWRDVRWRELIGHGEIVRKQRWSRSESIATEVGRRNKIIQIHLMRAGANSDVASTSVS